MKTNLTEKKIELTKAEMKAAMTYGTAEYTALQAIRRDYPGFEVVEAMKVKKTAKTPLDRLNMTIIKAYVKAHGSPEQKMAFLTISTATIDDDGIYHAPQDFFTIRKWFLVEFPQYKAALEKHNAEIISINEAIEAKIAAAAQKSAEEARARAAAEAKSFMETA